MKVTQEKLPASQVSLEIEIPGETSQSTYDKVINNLTRSAQIPGFRPGKVPRNILLQRFGKKQIKAAALEEIIQSSIREALEQEKLETIGQPSLRSDFEGLIGDFVPGKAVKFSAAFDVPPTVTLGEYTTLKIQAEEIKFKPEKVDEWLKQKQETFSTLVPIEDRTVQMDDVAIADYEGYEVNDDQSPGALIPDVAGTDLRIEMQTGRFIEGMVEGMVGMSLEETKEIPLKFPEDYPLESVAGKPVIFKLTLKELKAKESPELDDDFAQEASDNEFETLAELRRSLEERFQEEANSETKQNIHNQIKEELLKVCSVELPETLIVEQINRSISQTLRQMELMGVNIQEFLKLDQETVQRMQTEARPEAINRLQKDLIIDEISDKEGLVIENERIESRYQELLAEFSDEDIDHDKLRIVVEEELLAEATLNWLQEKVEIELVPEGTLSEPEETESITVEAETEEE